MRRSRRELPNEYLLAKFGFDTAENEPIQFLQFYSALGHLILAELSRPLRSFAPSERAVSARLLVAAHPNAAGARTARQVAYILWLATELTASFCI